MTESELQSMFTKWLKSNWSKGSAAFELKISQTKKIDHSEFQDHQLLAVTGATVDRGVVHKISDMAAGYKPFDCFILQRARGYFVLGFNDGADVFLVDAWAVWQKVVVPKDRSRRRGSITCLWAMGNGERVQGLG